MRRYWLLFIIALSAVAVFLGGVPPIYAQDDDQDEFQLEEVIVTAQKREESHQDVPIQMEVISGKDLAGTEMDNVDDILRNVSNSMINKNVDGMRVSIRGIAEEDRGGVGPTDLRTGTPTVAINIDGAYKNNAAAGQSLIDVERVEVLAGPQSTLYSSNSPGGIVNVVTAAPKTDKFDASVSVDFGNYAHFDGQAMINIPILRDKLAMRFAVQDFKQDSWTLGQTNERDSGTYRTKLLFEPNDKFSIGATYTYLSASTGGRLGGMVRTFDYQDGHYFEDLDGDGERDPVTNPWTSDAYFAGTWGKVGNAPSTRTARQRTNDWKLDFNLDTPIGYVTFIPYGSESIKSSFRSDAEIDVGGEEVTTPIKREEQQEEDGAEVRIVSHEDSPFEWIVGATYYESYQIGYSDYTEYPENNRTNEVTRDNKAFYANITYPFTDRFRGSAGYRRSWDEARMVATPPKIKDGITGQDYVEPDYKVGIEYDLSQESLLYASWATSYRVNTMSDSTDDRPVPPERLDAYTVGVKNRFWNDRLQVNASAFYYDYRDRRLHPQQDGRIDTGLPLIESQLGWEGEPGGADFNNDGDYCDTNIAAGKGKVSGDPPEADAACPDGYTRDLVGLFFHDPWESQWGDLESVGVDVSIDAMLTPNDLVKFSVSWLDTEWVDAVDEFYWKGYCEYQPKDCTEGRVYNGLPNTYSPEWSVNTKYEHRFDLGTKGTLVPSVDFQYKSEYDLTFRTEYNPYNQQEAYWIWNASMVYRPPSGRWSLRAYVKNIDEYAAKLFYSQRFGGVEVTTMGITDPRQYGIVFNWNLGR